MKTSESIEALAAALSAAQGEIKNAKADAENPHYKSTYADLASVREAIQGPLSKNGLSILQLPVTSTNGKPALLSRMMHKSGQWVEGECELIIERPTMQGMGSAITYMKRYALAAMVGLAEDDDDGNEASRFAKKTQAQQSKQSAQQQSSYDPSFIVPLGKNKGKRIDSVPFEELSKTANWILEKEKAGEKIGPNWLAFLNQMDLMIGSSQEPQDPLQDIRA